MLLADNRIELDARPISPAQTVLEVVMLGHCPVRLTEKQKEATRYFGGPTPHLIDKAVDAAGNIHWEYVARDQQILDEISRLGFSRQAARLRELVRAFDAKCGPNFRRDEFKGAYTVEILCGRLMKEGVGLAEDNIESLNNLLKQPGLHGKVRQNKYVDPSYGLQKLETEYLEERNENTLKWLNRLVLEEYYPQETPKNPKRILLKEEDYPLLALYDLPIPVYSFGQFQSLFPDSFNTDTQYRSAVGGKRAWLPLAVQDFFMNGSGSLPLKLWIIRVDESKGRSAFLPPKIVNMIETESLGAFERALLIPHAGIVALPDLERLNIPAGIKEIPKLQMSPPELVFLPCGKETSSDQGEQPESNKASETPTRVNHSEILGLIANAIAKNRPDMQCLLAVPLATDSGSEYPGPDAEFLEYAAGAGGIRADDSLYEEPSRRTIEAARHLQLVYPYLRGPDRKLGSPAGLVAGMQAAVSQKYGPWRSIGGRALPGRSLPWPPQTQSRATALRNYPGVTVLLHRAGKTVVDDERMCASCLPVVALQRLNSEQRGSEHWRSAEIMRFMGWLRRELQSLGEKMAFDVDPRDLRPSIALHNFFIRLYALGALRGAKAEESFKLKQRNEGGSAVIFDIEIAPAYPIDMLRITFIQDRHASGASSSIEVANG